LNTDGVLKAVLRNSSSCGRYLEIRGEGDTLEEKF